MEQQENLSIERPNPLCNLELNPVDDPRNDPVVVYDNPIPDNLIPDNLIPDNPIPDNPIPRPVANNHPNDYKQILYIVSGIVLIIAILYYVISSNHAAMKLEMEMVKESLNKQVTDLANKQLQNKKLIQSLTDNAVTKLELEMVKESLIDKQMIDLTNHNKLILKHKLNQYLEDKLSLEYCSIQNNGNCSYKVKYTMPYVNIPHAMPVSSNHHTYGIAISGNIIASIPIWSREPPSCIYIHDISNSSNSRTQCSNIQVFIGVAITLDGKDLLSIIRRKDVYHILAKKINAAENEDEWIVIHKVLSVTKYSDLSAFAIHPIYGHIFFADIPNGRIHVLNSDFSYNYTFGGGKGNTKGKFLNLAFIAVNKKGHVYVTDIDRHCVLKFNSKGILIKEFGSDRLFHPVGIAIDSYGAVYVLDSYKKYNTHIYVFDSDGNFIHYIEYIRDGDEVMRIQGTWSIAIDDNDNLILPDNKRRRFIVI